MCASRPSQRAGGDHGSSGDLSPLDIIESGGRKKRIGLRELKKIVRRTTPLPPADRPMMAQRELMRGWHCHGIINIMLRPRVSQVSKSMFPFQRQRQQPAAAIDALSWKARPQPSSARCRWHHLGL